MDKSTNISPYCDDGSCCCASDRSTVVIIAVLSFAMGLVDILMNEECCDCNEILENVASLRQFLVTMFQMANLLLLLAAMVESAFLVQLYIWCILGFVIMSLVVSLLGFLFNVRVETLWTSINFISEVAFLFVIFRCLPTVDLYRKHIEGK